MNKFFKSIKRTPSLLRFMNKSTLNEFKANPDLFPDGNTESEAVVFQMEWHVAIQPPDVFLHKFGYSKFSWIPLAQEDELPTLCNIQNQSLIACFNNPMVLCVNWTALNSKNEAVFLDVSGAISLSQAFPFVPSLKNDIRRLFQIDRKSLVEEAIQQDNGVFAKYISQVALINSEEDCFFVDTNEMGVRLQVNVLNMQNQLSYSELLRFAKKKQKRSFPAMIVALENTSKSQCVDLTRIESLKVTPTFKFLFV